ncbi:MAG TPA: glycosyltransferase family 1 protein [Thermoanaerobaculia bacterium]|nr:glycosyltransferase family 1 protein [Thermoanaerobaculia bacterium]
MQAVQIVPRLPPPFEGVGSYATALAGALGERSGVQERFVVGDPSWRGGAAGGARAVARRRAADLLTALEETDGPVLLHYAGYGYHSRGCPVWLVKGLLRWRGGAPHRRLVTLFHEVWASGPPWRSSFWLLPLQRRLAAALIRASDALATSLPLYRTLLLPWAGGREIVVMPVFSTVGEPAVAPPWSERTPRIVVFGGEGVRRRAYGPFLSALARAARVLGAVEICDIGAGIGASALPAEAGGVPIRALGPLPGPEVSALLLDSTAGFLAYPPAFLAKSTVFAAYCAHGTLPVCAWEGPLQEPPAAGHYWDAAGTGDFQSMAGAAQAWYAGHSLERQAAVFHGLLAGEAAVR